MLQSLVLGVDLACGLYFADFVGSITEVRVKFFSYLPVCELAVYDKTDYSLD